MTSPAKPRTWWDEYEYERKKWLDVRTHVGVLIVQMDECLRIQPTSDRITNFDDANAEKVIKTLLASYPMFSISCACYNPQKTREENIAGLMQRCRDLFQNFSFEVAPHLTYSNAEYRNAACQQLCGAFRQAHANIVSLVGSGGEFNHLGRALQQACDSAGINLSQPFVPDTEYDRQGFDQKGFDRQGYDREGFDQDGFDRLAYDRDGYNESGFDRQGYDWEGYHQDGFDRLGYDRDGYNQSGFDRQGYDREGNPEISPEEDEGNEHFSRGRASSRPAMPNEKRKRTV